MEYCALISMVSSIYSFALVRLVLDKKNVSLKQTTKPNGSLPSAHLQIGKQERGKRLACFLKTNARHKKHSF
jgi:hypothetical protein